MSELRQNRMPLTVLLIILLCRLLTLQMYPLMDTTEARYAEIARKMLETGNWITPQFDYAIPFWGKPPLSFWASAMTMAIFGVNEFGARAAPFLASVLLGVLFFAWPFKENRVRKALICFIVMQTTAIGVVVSGAVMTDEYLYLGVSLSLVAFWKTMNQKCRAIWPYLFFIGLAVGLLARGPLAFILVGFPVFFWTLINKEWRALWTRLPWIKGTLLLLILTVPWYVAAERATPGFLRYYIIGEHFERFLVRGWTGDLYGRAHAEPLGTIWLFAGMCALPWLLLFPMFFWKKALVFEKRASSFLLLWLAGPLLFFTFAGNILPAYVLPAFFPFCILIAQALELMTAEQPGHGRLLAVPAALMIVVTLTLATPVLDNVFNRRCHKELLASWDGESDLIYLGERTFSGQFYSHGRAGLVVDAAGYRRLEETRRPTTLIMGEGIYQARFVGDERWHLVAAAAKGWHMLTNFPRESSR